jgi:hypothetical protein
MKHSTFALVCSWVAIAIFRINIRVWEVIILGAFQKCLYFSYPSLHVYSCMLLVLACMCVLGAEQHNFIMARLGYLVHFISPHLHLVIRKKKTHWNIKQQQQQQLLWNSGII